ncbi:hypothetical protein PIB30_028003 [Stylosanthes scabra]|uniref:Uncharacterized protein n=1 Tax=Stylosanthes scabra TaxID=79078 RepID=A0ABU6XCJ3_9FABA|nr:hypothetical protein [Stylosanthes scabra]
MVLRGSTNDGCPELVPDRSGLAIFILRIEIVNTLSSTGSDLSCVVEAWGVTGINPAPTHSLWRKPGVNRTPSNGVDSTQWRARALRRKLRHEARVVRPRCEALDVSFPMVLEPSHLDLCSSSYDQISDRRSGLTALGDSLGADLRMQTRHRIA